MCCIFLIWGKLVFGGLGQNKDGLYFPSHFLWIIGFWGLNLSILLRQIVRLSVRDLWLSRMNAIMMMTHTKIPISNIVVYFLNVCKDRLFVLKKQIFQGELVADSRKIFIWEFVYLERERFGAMMAEWEINNWRPPRVRRIAPLGSAMADPRGAIL